MANVIQRYLPLNVTQGGANAFVETSAATEIIPSEGLAWKITLIEVAIETELCTVASAGGISWAITRDTKAAMPDLVDTDVIHKGGFFQPMASAVGFSNSPRTSIFEPKNAYIVEPTIYACFDSTGYTPVLEFSVRIWYETVRLSEVEILRILNNA